MAADLVAFAHDALHQADVVGGFIADEEEGAFDVLLLQDVEDLRRPPGIGAVVEGERKLFGMVAVLLDGVGARIDVHVFVNDELFARVGLVVIRFDSALAGLRQAGDADDVAVALGVDVVAGLDGAERLRGLRVAGPIPDVPQRAVFFAETPKCEGLQAELARGAHLVEQRDAVEKPDHVALVIVLVDVLEVRIERVVVEIEIGIGIGGFLPGLGDGKILGIENLRLADGGDLSDWESKASSRSHSWPVRR